MRGVVANSYLLLERPPADTALVRKSEKIMTQEKCNNHFFRNLQSSCGHERWADHHFGRCQESGGQKVTTHLTTVKFWGNRICRSSHHTYTGYAVNSVLYTNWWMRPWNLLQLNLVFFLFPLERCMSLNFVDEYAKFVHAVRRPICLQKWLNEMAT